ncbi:MAG: septum site-determining protein MinC [Microcystaceae cyanobacterium]
MISEPAVPVTDSDFSPSTLPAEYYLQVHLKSDGEKLLLILPKPSQNTTNDWTEIGQALKYCLKSSDRTWDSGTNIQLISHDRLLDCRQLQTIAEILQEAKLQLKCICTSRRQTAVAAATAGYSVEQEALTQSLSVRSEAPHSPLAEPLYWKTTVRSGIEIRHPGTVIILGDVNPGGQVIADGDILIWGGLRGIAHAGAQGNRACRIMSLRMKPTQLRIADKVARAPEVAPEHFDPEVAYITPEGIRIAQAINFSKTHSFKNGAWIKKNSEFAIRNSERRVEG